MFKAIGMLFTAIYNICEMVAGFAGAAAILGRTAEAETGGLATAMAKTREDRHDRFLASMSE